MTGRRIGFTTRASCLLAAGVTAVLCGVVLGETDLVRAGVLAAAIPLAAAVVVHRSRIRIASRRVIEPREVAAGQAVTVHLTITNRAVLPTGALRLEDQLPDRFTGRARFVLDSLGRGGDRTVSYRLPELGRGRYRVGPLHVRLNDPFHMIELTRSFTATTEFLVHAAVDDLAAAQPPRTDDPGDGSGSHSVGSHGADDASTREYRIGDDLRKIHWKSSARTGSLMVRQEERPWRSQTTLLLDQRSGAHAAAAPQPGVDRRTTDSFEWAVSAVASVAEQAMRAGRDVGLLGDPTRPELLRFGSRLQLAGHLAVVRPVPGEHLTAMAAAVRTAARDSALVAVLGRLDPHALRLLADAHPRGRSTPSLAMLLDVGTWADDPAGPSDDPALATLSPSADVRRSASILTEAGWRAVVVTAGMSTPRAWQLLTSGVGASPRMALR